MKRFSLILLSLLLIAACAGSFAEEAPWVTMENVREHSGYVWREEIPHYNGAEEQGFQPLAMDPAEAYLQVRNAYDRGQNEAVRELLQSWGIEMEPCGAPVLRELISQADLQHHGNASISTENVPLVQLISFSGWGWGEEGTLIFVEHWPDWYDFTLLHRLSLKCYIPRLAKPRAIWYICYDVDSEGGIEHESEIAVNGYTTINPFPYEYMSSRSSIRYRCQ